MLFRLAVNHYEFVKHDGTWLINRRLSEVLGSDAVQNLMRLGLPKRLLRGLLTTASDRGGRFLLSRLHE